MPYWTQVIVNIIFSFIATIGFGLIINIPRRALIYSGLSGTAGWMVYWLLSQTGIGRMLSNLSAALVIGIIGIFLARYKRMPVILFNIPALIPLVPGVPAYEAVRELVFGDLNEAMVLAFRVLTIISAIAIGFMLAQVVGELSRSYIIARRNRN